MIKNNLIKTSALNVFLIDLKKITWTFELDLKSMLFVFLFNRNFNNFFVYEDFYSFFTFIAEKEKRIGFFFNFFYFFSKFLFIRLNLFLFKYINFLIYIEKNYLSMYVSNKYLYFFLKYIKLSHLFLFKILTDLTAIDYLGYNFKKRFKLSYNLTSLKFNYKLFVNNFTDYKSGLNSLFLIFPNSVWLEREVWDMFGILFFNNPDFRRILTDYGFKWFPMRKDFPVSGYIELWYDEITGNIIYKPIKLMQEMRFYNFVSNWENLY